MDRQKNFEREMKKGIKQFEKKSRRKYDPYGKMSQIKEPIEYIQESKKDNGCWGCLKGCLTFVCIMIFIAFIFLLIIMFL